MIHSVKIKNDNSLLKHRIGGGYKITEKCFMESPKWFSGRCGPKCEIFTGRNEPLIVSINF